MNPRPRRRGGVVVLGGSLAGLFAAAAAAGAGRHVTVLERDAEPQDMEPRSGVPQGRQALVAAGAVPLDIPATPGAVVGKPHADNATSTALLPYPAWAAPALSH